jgi:hypothetical protein
MPIQSFKAYNIITMSALHQNFQFRYRSETTKTTISKQTEKTGKPVNFLKKYKNMLHIKLFRLVFCLFWFNRNTGNLCSGIEAKQPKQTFW